MAGFELVVNLIFGLLLSAAAILCFIFPRQAWKWFSGRKRREDEAGSPAWMVLFLYRVVGALLFMAFLFFLLGVLHSG